MQKSAGIKSSRMLELYLRFQQGVVLNKSDLAKEYGVASRSIQRDIDDLRAFLVEKGIAQQIVYDRMKGGYRLIDDHEAKLSNEESSLPSRFCWKAGH